MNYISTTQAAEKWGITPNRVFKLVSKGRIQGAVKIGSMWMIPANAKKPADGRTKSSRDAATKNDDFFRYPVFEHRDVNSFNPPLSQEELIIKGTLEAFHACRYSEANRTLGDLPETAQNRYIRINALYEGCMIDCLLGNIERFFDRYVHLVTELREDFAHKLEMQQYLYLIDVWIGNPSYFEKAFTVDPSYEYHESFLPRLATLRALSLSDAGKNMKTADMSSFETTCFLLEQYDAPCEIQSMHLYLGVGYTHLGMTKEAEFHFEKALYYAEQYELYHAVIGYYCYYKEFFEPILANYPQELKEKLEFLGEDYLERFRCTLNKLFAEKVPKDEFIFPLSTRDYLLIFNAVQGNTNKEIARFLHVSTGTIGKRYSEIYHKLGVKNKKELIDRYMSARDTPFFD